MVEHETVGGCERPPAEDLAAEAPPGRADGAEEAVQEGLPGAPAAAVRAGLGCKLRKINVCLE